MGADDQRGAELFTKIGLYLPARTDHWETVPLGRIREAKGKPSFDI